MSLLYRLAWILFRALFRVYFRWRVYSAECVPRQGPVILAANHASVLDPPVVATGLRHEVHFLARDTLFRGRLWSALLRRLNAIPVDREGGGPAGIKAALACLRAENSIILFPEGTRSPDGRLQRARAGIGLIVVRSGAPVVPVRVFGTFEAMGRGRPFPRPKRIAVKYGAPIRFDSQCAEARGASKDHLRKIYQRIADDILAAIARLEPGDERQKPLIGPTL